MTEHIFYPSDQVACRNRELSGYILEDIIVIADSGAIGESELRWHRKLFQPSKEHLAKMLAEVSKGEDQVIDWGK